MAVLFTCLLGASAVILGYALYDSNRQNFARETEAAIDHEIASILTLADGKEGSAIVALIHQKSSAAPPYYRYESPEGKMLSGNLATLPNNIELIKEGLLRFTKAEQGITSTLAAKIHTFSDGSRLLIARDISAITSSHERLWWAATCILTLMSAVVVVSFFLSYFVVSRINRIGYTARHIMRTGDLSQRIPIETRWDDLSNLAQLLNALLDRMETLLSGIRDVSDHIAHDLRTPLTRLRQGLEEARLHTSPPERMDMLITEADRLLATFQALLRISAIEKQCDRQRFAPLDPAALLRDVWELYEPLMEEKSLCPTLSLPEGLLLKGDRDLLFQLFANLLDNTIKFSPPGGTIHLALLPDRDGCHIILRDRGEGIADNDKQRVFDRFYRSDASRHREGNGLGLSLVKAVAELHGATLMLKDAHPGLEIVVTFPLT